MFDMIPSNRLSGVMDAIKSIWPDRMPEKVTVFSACHNDLNFSNLLFNGEKTYLIDWEAACLEDPFFDLAMVCNEFTGDGVDRAYFLEQYFGQGLTDLEEAKLNGMRQIAYCYLALHFLEHAQHLGVTEQFLIIA